MHVLEVETKWDLEGYEDVSEWISEIKKLPRSAALVRLVVRLKSCSAIIAGLCLEAGTGSEEEVEEVAEPVVAVRTPVTRRSTREAPVSGTVENDPKVRRLYWPLASLLM
jgi:hypothetical protein